MREKPHHYDQQCLDLARKAATDTADAINRTLALIDTPAQAEAVAIMAFGSAAGILAGALAGTRGLDERAAYELAADLMTMMADPEKRAALLGQPVPHPRNIDDMEAGRVPTVAREGGE